VGEQPADHLNASMNHSRVKRSEVIASGTINFRAACKQGLGHLHLWM